MRRRSFVLALVTAAIVLLVVAPAFANTGTKSGGYWPYSTTYNVFYAVDGTADVIASPSISPHSGYTTTTGKCKVCHAVHGAGSTDSTGTTLNPSEVLLRTTEADACTFCHLTGSFATNPYFGDSFNPNPIANYQGTNPGSGHFSNHEGTPYAGCPSCHAVHGAQTIGNHDFILKNDPAKGVVSVTAINSGYGSRKLPVTTQTDFCLDCHDGTQWISTTGVSTPIVSVAQFSAQFPACGGCHNSVSPTITANDTQFGVAFNQGHNGRSHPMTTNRRGLDGVTIVAGSSTAIPSAENPNPALQPSVGTSCTTCHDVNGNGDFPHYLSRDQELISGFRYLTHLDAVCIGCHNRVGIDW